MFAYLLISMFISFLFQNHVKYKANIYQIKNATRRMTTMKIVNKT